MHLTAPNGAVITKTRELCQTILDQPEFKDILQDIQTFVSHDEARQQYEMVSEKGNALRAKQEQGQELSPAEIEDFEKQRDALLGNPVASRFFEAQSILHELKKMVTIHVNKTLELGRLPEAQDFQSSGCGSGCECH